MAKKMTGIVAQFGTKGYGFITGDDGEKYFVHQKNVFNKSRLRSDTRVKFKVETSDKGLVAIDVKLEKVVEESTPLTCLLYTSPSPRDKRQSRMPSSA